MKKTLKRGKRVYRLKRSGMDCGANRCAFALGAPACPGDCSAPLGVWRETFLSRLRRWWEALMATPLPDMLDESNAITRYRMAAEATPCPSCERPSDQDCTLCAEARAARSGDLFPATNSSGSPIARKAKEAAGLLEGDAS